MEFKMVSSQAFLYCFTLSAVLLMSACANQAEFVYDSATVVSLADDDGDGVINARELCPLTIVGAQVDNDGCPEIKENVLTVNLKVLFDHDSYIIKESNHQELANFADMIKKSQNINVELEGHASIVGSNKYNLLLSTRRADAVRDVLVYKFNIDESKLTAVAFGESKLVALGDTETQHSLNRRVVAHIQILEQEDMLRWTIYTTETKKLPISNGNNN